MGHISLHISGGQAEQVDTGGSHHQGPLPAGAKVEEPDRLGEFVQDLGYDDVQTIPGRKQVPSGGDHPPTPIPSTTTSTSPAQSG